MKRSAETTAVFESLPVLQALKIMALPTIISQLIVLIYNFADTFYVGKTNDPHMVAALSLILPVFNISLSLANLTSVGSGTLISRLLGEKREDEARRVGAFSVYAAIIAAALFSLVMAVFMEPILYLLGADEHTMLYAKQYSYCVIVFGGVPTVLSNVLSNLLRSAGASKEAGFGITFGGLINIALDPLFMFVLMPRGCEVLGAGVATCISNFIACFYFAFVIFRMGKDSVVTFSLKGGMPSPRSIRSTFGVGVPAALTTFLFDLDYVVIDRLMVEYGNIALAAVGIVLKAERLPLNFGVGLCQGMMPLVAYNYSSGDHKRMKAVMLCALKVGLITSALSIAMYELSAPYIMRAFITEAGTVELGTDFLRIRVLATPLMFMSFFTVFLFQAFGRGDKAFFLGVSRWLVLNIPMLFILNGIFGMYGIVWSQTAADILTVALSFYVYRQYERASLKRL